ncbi:MAG TPA: hypothetical protein VGM08_04620 [Candidatus Saccharimonadales bacterium]|jgi:diadenosine tetraphosphate (Ap4A) HIT family hydrolase
MNVNKRNPDCGQIYERIFYGILPARVAYRNEEHGILIIQDPMPIARGHLVAATVACTDTVDRLPRSPYDKLQTAAKYAGLVLEVAFADAPYIASAIAGKQIRHPHAHRAAADDEADWAKRLGKALPRLELSEAEKDQIHERVTIGDAVEGLWQELDKALDAHGPVDPLTLETMEFMAASLDGAEV